MDGPRWSPWDALPQILRELRTCRISREELAETAELVEFLSSAGGLAAGMELAALRLGRPELDDAGVGKTGGGRAGSDGAEEVESGNENPFGFAVFNAAIGTTTVPLHARCLTWRKKSPQSVWVFFVVCARGPRVRFIGAATARAFAANTTAFALSMSVRARLACPGSQ